MRKLVGIAALVALAGLAACNSLLGNGVHSWDGGLAGATETGTGGRNNSSGGAGGHSGTTGSGGGAGKAGSNGGSATGGVPNTGGNGGNGGFANTGGTSATGGSAGHGGSSATGGSGGTGGQVATGGSTGGTHSTGGAATGGAATGGAATGGAATGGTATGGAATGGAGGTGGSPPVPSNGCSVSDGRTKLTTGGSSVANGLATSTRLNMTSGTSSREYIIDIPADYDPTHPYRLIFSWHQLGGSDTGNATGIHPAVDGPNFDANQYAFFGLRREATAANQPAIFVATNGSSGLPWDYARDSVLFDDLLALIDANLCIDDSRVFSTGFSLGAIMSYALSITRQTKLRAVVAMAAVNYNFAGVPADTKVPLAYMGTTGMSDGTCPWGTDTMGGKACVLQHAQDNGCTIPATIPTATGGSKTYLCYDFVGCKPGYPVKVCTFDGPHTPASVDNGTTSGDDGMNAFIPPLAWKFIAQF